MDENHCLWRTALVLVVWLFEECRTQTTLLETEHLKLEPAETCLQHLSCFAACGVYYGIKKKTAWSFSPSHDCQWFPSRGQAHNAGWLEWISAAGMAAGHFLDLPRWLQWAAKFKNITLRKQENPVEFLWSHICLLYSVKLTVASAHPHSPTEDRDINLFFSFKAEEALSLGPWPVSLHMHT